MLVLVYHLQKNKERIQKFKEAVDLWYIYQSKLDKAGMTYGDFNDLTRRTTSDEILHDKAFNIYKSPKYYGY